MDERIKGLMNEAIDEFKTELMTDAEVERGLRLALSLYELGRKIAESEKAESIDLLMLEVLQGEFSRWYEKGKAARSENLHEWVQDIKPVMDIMRLFYAVMEEVEHKSKNAEGEEIAIDGLPSDIKHEIIEGLKNTQETGIAYIVDNPLLKELVKRGATQQQTDSNIKVISEGDLTVKKGDLTIYQNEILNNLAKCKKEGLQVLKSGKCYLTVGQLYKWISGGAKDSLSEVQRNELINALSEMRGKGLKYSTSEELADILGIELDAELAEFKVEEADEQLISCNFYTGTIRGQKSTLIVFEFARIINNMLDCLPWYEPMDQEVKRVQYIDSKGKLKDWNLTKERIELRTCVYKFVFSYIRARSVGSGYSNKKTYASIFEECQIDVSHRQKRQRRLQDIAVILDHLKMKGIISGWEEYANRGSKRPDGIKIRVAKEIVEG